MLFDVRLTADAFMREGADVRSVSCLGAGQSNEFDYVNDDILFICSRESNNIFFFLFVLNDHQNLI